MPQDKIKAALIRFSAAITNSDGAALSASLNEVEALLGAHRRELDPRLAHFLEGRSYAKALAWLGGDAEFGSASSPPGGCGGGHA